MVTRVTWATAAVAMLLVTAAASAQANDRTICFAAAGKAADEARLKACERLIASGRVSGRDLASAYNNRGHAYTNLGQYDQAIAELDEAIRRNPTDATAYSNRGLAYSKLGQHDRAIAELDEAIRRDPATPHVYGNRGVAYFGKGDDSRALADFSEAIRRNPASTDLYYNRANAYARTDQIELALADIRKLLRINPKDADGKRWLPQLEQWQAAAAAPQAATPAPVKEVFEQYRLLGIFSANCTKPASNSNPWHVFRVLDDSHAQYDFMIGPTERKDAYMIDSASLRGPKHAALSAQRSKEGGAAERVDLVLQVEGPRWRVLERLEDGRKSVSDGISADDKRATSWVNKCG